MSLPEYLTCSLIEAQGNLEKKWEMAKEHIKRVIRLSDSGMTIDDYSIEINKNQAVFRQHKINKEGE